MIKTTVEETGPCRKKLTVEVPVEKVTEAFDELVGRYAAAARVPGFRPGRAPRPVVERRFSREIRDDLRDRLLPEAYREALESEKIKSVAILDLNAATPEKDKPFSFEVTLDVAPDFETPMYKGIAVQAEAIATVTEEEVEAIVERLRTSRARYEEAEGRPLAEHDLARIDFHATLDGKPLGEVVPSASALDKGEGFQVSLDEAAFLPELAKGLVGAAVGDERDIDVTFPDGFTLNDLVGRTATFHVKVTGIRERILPEADDAFAKQHGIESMDALRTRIRGDMEADRAAAEERRVRNELARHLIESVTMDLPESVTERTTQRLVYDRVRENASRGVPQDQMVEHKQEIFEHAQRDARDQLKLNYVLRSITELESIEVSDEDLNAEIDRILESAGAQAEELRKRFTETEERENLRERMASGRALDFVRTEAKIQPAAG